MKFDFTDYTPHQRVPACDKTEHCAAPNHRTFCKKLAKDVAAFKADRETYYARRK